MRWESNRPVDLIAIAALVLLTVVAVAFDLGPVRVALGLLFVLFAPGYVLVATLFPAGPPPAELKVDGRRTGGGLGGLERVALSLGLSIAVVPLVGLALNATAWGVRLVPILVSLALFTTIFLSLAWWRRSRTLAPLRPRFSIHFEQSTWREASVATRALTVALIIAIVVAGGALTYVLLVPAPKERFTEFYILGPGGKAEGYPDHLAAGGTGMLIVGVVPHEGSTTTYRVDGILVAGNLSTDGTGNQTFTPSHNQSVIAETLVVPDEATHEKNVTIRAPEAPGTYRLELTLYKGDESIAYRNLHLWITVTA